MEYYSSEKINENLILIRSLSGELMYLLTSEGKGALIDSCVGVGHLKEYVEKLTDSKITLFLTHGHIDHAMGAPDFETVYMNHKDISLYQSQCSLEERQGYVRGCAGEAVFGALKVQDYTVAEPDKYFEDLKDGDSFEIGKFHLDCYAFPGHTPGSMAFLIREMGILILGDACNNSTFVFDENSLPLDRYREQVIFNRSRLKGRYTRVFLSHHVMETDTEIMDNVIAVCNEALEGKADDLPFSFMGMDACIAKRCNERFEREDGKSGNIIYNKERLHGEAKYLAIDVGGTFTKYAIITEECQILEKDKCKTVMEPLDDFLTSLVRIYEKYKGEVDGIALSMAGIIDSETGFMYTGGNLTCITNLNIVEVLEKRCGVHVTVENDAKCAALAEVWKGALMDVNDAVVVVCGTGVGGAVIHDRKVMKGIHNMTGEFSYVMTESKPEYALDHSLAGNTGIKSLMQDVSRYTGIAAEELDGERVFSMANCGDEKAIAGIREYVRRLAIQINNYQFILDPEKIVIGGGISVQPLFLQMIKEELKKINAVYPWNLPIADVSVCKFFNDANLIGAVYVHIKSKERKIDIDKMNELLDMVKDRREGQYLMELLGK